MNDHSQAIFRARYESLKSTFEARLASLADVIRSAVENTRQDEVLLQLSSSGNTREFAPAHARALIKRHLESERDTFFHGLAARLADAEAKVIQCDRRIEELESTVALLRGDAARKEQGRAEAVAVNADIRQLRQEYQISLEASTEECRQLKAELSRAKQQSGELAVERDEHAAQARSLQQATVDAKVKALEVLSLERELGKYKSANIKMCSELEQSQRKLEGLASNHQNLQVQAVSLQNDLRQRDRRLQLADVNRKKNEAQFRETVSRMESLMEQEGRENVSAIKSLREKTESLKDKLSTEIERQSVANRQLTNSLTAAKAKGVELELRLQAALKAKEMDASAAAAREAMLHAEAEQARTRADTMSQTLAEAIREQSGLVTETANAKVAAQILEEKSRAAEVEMARAAGRETGRAQALHQECILSTAPFSGWEVDTLLAEKLQEASNHISELRTVLRQEVRRREAAEADVSEAQGYLNSSRQELGDLRQLAWKLEQMGRSSIAGIDGKKVVTRPLEEVVLHTPAGAGESEGRTLTETFGTPVRETAYRGGHHHGQQRSPRYSGSETKARRGIVEAEEKGPKRHATQLTISQTLPSTKVGLAALRKILSGLRSELRYVKAQLVETESNSKELVRNCIEEIGLRVQALAQSLQQASRERAEARRQTMEATTVGARHKEGADTLARLVQGISTILFDSLGVGVPISLTGVGAAGKEAEGMLKKGLSELASNVADAVSSATGSTKQTLLVETHQRCPSRQSHHDSSASADGQRRSPTLDGMIWGERSKDDFNMLAQLQKIETESELQSLQARLDEMAAKYSRAVAENGTVDNEPLREERQRAKEELARVARAHGGVVSALDAALSAEKSHCQDLRARLERQTHQHEAALGEGEQRLLSTQQELDKAQQALEHAKFALERETARRARLEKKYRELEDRGLVSPRSVSPRSVSPRVWRSETTCRKAFEGPQTGQVVQPIQPRPSSARLVLEEARAKLGQDSDVSCATRDWPGDGVVRQGESLELNEPTKEGDPVGGSKEGADQSTPASVRSP